MSRRRLSARAWVAVAWLAAVVVAAVAAPTAVPFPDLSHASAAPGQPPHWLGTDAQGQDVALLLLLGARTVLLVSLPAALLAVGLGALLGSCAGFWQNHRWRISQATLLAAVLAATATALWPIHIATRPHWALLVLLGSTAAWRAVRRWRWGQRPRFFPLDHLVQALMALLDSVPLLVLVLVVAALQRPSVAGLVVLLAATCWTTPARLMRAATLQVQARPYVEAARAAGLSDWQVLIRHVWPATWHVLLVRFPLTVAVLIGLETTLSFLGVGLPPEVPSWGRLLAAVRYTPGSWWLLVLPGAALAFTLLSLHRLTTSIKRLLPPGFNVTNH